MVKKIRQSNETFFFVSIDAAREQIYLFEIFQMKIEGEFIATYIN